MPNPYYQGPPTDHFDGERFFHPSLPAADKTLLDILRWRFQDKRASWPAHVSAASGVRPLERVDDISITAIGHASLLIQVAGINLLLDPVWADRVSPLRFLGPRRHNPPAIAFDDLPPIDCVLLTHNHYDHMDVTTLKRLWQTYHPVVVSPLGNDAVIHKSAPEIEVRTGDWWDTFTLPGELRATIVPSYHWSSRSLRDRRMALWGGFMLETPAGLIYCAGDTAFRDGVIFHQIRERFGPPRVALLPIGAYAPRWFMDTQHIDPQEAVRIASICGAQQALGIHWNTFQLTDEPHDEPEQCLEEAVRAQPGVGCPFHALHPGDVWTAQQGLNSETAAATLAQAD